MTSTIALLAMSETPAPDIGVVTPSQDNRAVTPRPEDAITSASSVQVTAVSARGPPRKRRPRTPPEDAAAEDVHATVELAPEDGAGQRSRRRPRSRDVAADDPDVHLPGPAVEKMFAICSMTLRRWRRSPTLNFPKPIEINGRFYWKLGELRAFSARQQAASAGR